MTGLGGDGASATASLPPRSGASGRAGARDLMGTQRLLVVRRARWRVDEPGASTAAEETAHGVHAPAGDVLAKRPDWQA